MTNEGFEQVGAMLQRVSSASFRPSNFGGYLRVRALLGAFCFRVSQVPHPVWALAVCAVFTAVGVAVLDDYGVSWDEFYQRDIALETISYVLGQDDELLSNHDKFYGTAFEVPLLIVERVLGLQDDTRAILLSRHILSHLFFIAGGFFCYLLTRRLFGSTVIALFALPVYVKQQGRSRRTVFFDFGEKGVKFDGKCLMVFQLPEYPTDQISVGHQIGGRGHFWGNLAELRAVERMVEDAGDPVIRSDWDVYLVEDSLIYVRDPCSPEDVEPEFFLHVDPVDVNDLPSHRQQHGFDGFHFDFRNHLLIEGGACVVRRELPDYTYTIAAVRTGQFTGEGKKIWEGSFDIVDPAGDGKAAP